MFSTTHHHYQHPPPSPPPPLCSQGHRSTLVLPTFEGEAICLLCFSTLISTPKSPTVHVSYALSQLSIALSQPQFLHTFITHHSRFLISPLLILLGGIEDDPIANQATELIVKIVENGDEDVYGEIVGRVAEKLSSGALAWSRKQLYMLLDGIEDDPIANQVIDLVVKIVENGDDDVYGEIVSRVSDSDKLSSGCLTWNCKQLYRGCPSLHCLGILLNCDKTSPYAYVKDKYALVANLVTGLQLSSEEVQGEILFLLYKLSLSKEESVDYDWFDALSANCPKVLYLSLEALMKTQSEVVRLNCVALLKVLAQRGIIESQLDKDAFGADNFMGSTEQIERPPLNIIFAEALKGALLSSDSEVQIATLDLIVLYLSWGGDSKKCQGLLEENIADYIFEILRLSGCKDPLINSCIMILDLLSAAEKSFRQRLAVGFSTLLPVLRFVVEIPFHPVQTQSMKLIWNCILNCPGAVATSHVEEVGAVLTGLLEKHVIGEIDMPPETFSLSCSILVALMKCSCSSGSSSLSTSIQNSSKHALLICLRDYAKHPRKTLDSLYLVKEAYGHAHEGSLTGSVNMELGNSILEICNEHLLPWFLSEVSNIEDEEIALGVLEILHAILLQDSNMETTMFTKNLVSFSWFSFSFGCLGMFPTEKMKWRIYFVFSSIADLLLGSNYGQLIRDAASDMPFDPIDLLFVLGQNSFDSQQLVTCQSAILLLLYMSSLYDDRLADVKLIFASLEQYILLNIGESLGEAHSPVRLEWLVSLYGLCRSLAKLSYQIPYSPEAERIIFQLMDVRGCDLLDSGMHTSSLKWLFQQGKICKSLTDQLLKFCRCNSSNSNFIVDQRKDDHTLESNVVAELIASGDNYAPLLLVWLLRDVIQNDQENDYLSVVSTLTRMMEILATASNQLSANGIGEAIQKIYHHPMYSSSLEIRMVTSKLVFTLLHSVSSNSISDGDAWVSMVVKLVDSLFHTVASEGWTQETLIIVGILSLVLHHSANNALIEASKTILLNTPLISTINSTIFDACLKGPALTDLDEEARNGEILISLLFLLFYSMRSVDAILPGILDWQSLFDMQDKMQHLSYISIRCHDLSKLIHYGSPVIKLIASHCLLDIFSKISVHKIKTPVELEIRTGYLLSVVAILEGLVFYEDVRVSTNCALCLSMIMSWEELNIELLVSERSQWCRLIIEELVMSFAAPCLASKSFVAHHKPAVHIFVALLKMRNLPKWLSSVLDSSCIAGIIEKLSPNQFTAELVIFFREILLAGYLKPDQIASLGRMLQACRKQISTGEIRDLREEEHTEKIIDGSDDLQRVSGVLMRNMIHLSLFNTNSKGLLEEIELFSKCLMEED